MRGPLLALLLAVPLALAACDSADSDGTSLRYAVQLREAGGSTAAATGELRFTEAPRRGDASVTGQYTLTATGGGAFPPLPQTSGSFTGAYESDSLVVQLVVPGSSDVGVELSGTFSSQTYAGVWSELTIAGPQARGSFTATATSGDGD
jgi:hypothetical protein